MEIATLNLRAEVEKLPEGRFSDFSNEILLSALNETRQIFGQGIEIDVLVEQGSISAKIKFIGKAGVVIVGAAYTGTATYPTFEEGLALLQIRAEQLGDIVSEKFENIVKPANGKVVKKQINLGDVDKIKAVTELLKNAQKTKDERERNIFIQQAIEILLKLKRSNDFEEVDVFLRQLPTENLPFPKTAEELLAIEEGRRETGKRKFTRDSQMQIPGLLLEKTIPSPDIPDDEEEKLRFHKRVTT